MKIILSENQLNVYNQYLVENRLMESKLVEIKKHIKNARGITDENKEWALNNFKSYTEVKKSKIFGLELHPELKQKIKEKSLPNGFDMGIDKNGYFIHTHRARSKSHEKPNGITEKEIKFIDSTG